MYAPKEANDIYGCPVKLQSGYDREIPESAWPVAVFSERLTHHGVRQLQQPSILLASIQQGKREVLAQQLSEHDHELHFSLKLKADMQMYCRLGSERRESVLAR